MINYLYNTYLRLTYKYRKSTFAIKPTSLYTGWDFVNPELYLVGEHWGRYRKVFPYQYYVPPSIDFNNGAVFYTEYNPITVPVRGDECKTITIPYRNSGVEGKFTIKGGFKAEVEIERLKYKPKFNHEAPLWFVTRQSWPPEIDVVEIYDNNWAPNIHWVKKGKKKDLRPGRYKLDSEKTQKWGIDINDKKIKFYYNGVLIRVETNKIPNYNDIEWSPVMGSGIRKDPGTKEMGSSFILKYLAIEK